MPLDVTALETYVQRFVPEIEGPDVTLILIFPSRLAPCRHSYIYNSKESSVTGLRQFCYIFPPVKIIST